MVLILDRGAFAAAPGLVVEGCLGIGVGCDCAVPLAAGAILCPISCSTLRVRASYHADASKPVAVSSPAPSIARPRTFRSSSYALIAVEPLFLFAYMLTGAVAGLLAGLLGIGGGAVIVPALILLFTRLGFGDAWIPHQAVATSLATVIATGAASAWSHHRHGAVHWKLFARLVPWILIGAWTGAYLAAWLPALWLTRLFALFLLYNGMRMLSNLPTKIERSLPSTPVLGSFATVIGALSALLGIGGGILIVPFLARQGVRMQHAVATSSACGIPLAVAGSIGFMLSGWGRPGLPDYSIGFVYWPAALAIIAASVPMAALGAYLAHRLPTRTLKRIFGLLLVLVGLRLLLA